MMTRILQIRFMAPVLSLVAQLVSSSIATAASPGLTNYGCVEGLVVTANVENEGLLAVNAKATHAQISARGDATCFFEANMNLGYVRGSAVRFSVDSEDRIQALISLENNRFLHFSTLMRSGIPSLDFIRDFTPAGIYEVVASPVLTNVKIAYATTSVLVPVKK